MAWVNVWRPARESPDSWGVQRAVAEGCDLPLDLPTRAYGALWRAGFGSRHRVQVTPDWELASVRNIGPATLTEIRRHIPYAPDRPVEVTSAHYDAFLARLQEAS